MTKEETKKILMVLEVTFPNFVVDNPERMVEAWHVFLQDYPAEEILLGLKTYVTTKGSAYAPSVSELIAMTRKPSELSATREAEAWAKVRKAIGNGLYNAKTEFENLPDEAKQVVIRPEQLTEWAQLPSDEIDTVVRSNFRRSYEAMQKRNAEIEAMPKEVRKLIENTKAKMIGVNA